MDPGLPSLRSARLRLARRSSPAKLFIPAIHFTLLEDGACIQGANAVSLGTQAIAQRKSAGSFPLLPVQI